MRLATQDQFIRDFLEKEYGERVACSGQVILESRFDVVTGVLWMLAGVSCAFTSLSYEVDFKIFIIILLGLSPFLMLLLAIKGGILYYDEDKVVSIRCRNLFSSQYIRKEFPYQQLGKVVLRKKRRGKHGARLERQYTFQSKTGLQVKVSIPFMTKDWFIFSFDDYLKEIAPTYGFMVDDVPMWKKALRLK